MTEDRIASLPSRPDREEWPDHPELRDLVDCCRSETLEERVIATFLGSSRAEERRVRLGSLRTALLWNALPSLLAADGWQVLGRRAFGREGEAVLAPLVDVLELGGDERLELPANIRVFAQRGDLRAVFTLDHYRRYASAGILASEGAQKILSDWQERIRTANPLRGRSLTPAGKFVDLGNPPPRWDDLFIADEIKDEIRFHVRRLEGHSVEDLRRLGIRRRGGLILSGPPGTGKTMTGRILAHSTRSTFLWVSAALLVDPHEVEEVLALARLLAPTILFLEDLDLVAEDRGLSCGTASLAELMNQLDGFAGDHPIFTIATTNRVEVVEKALRNRPGRFDRVIEIPPPDPTSARALLASRLEQHGVDDEGLDYLVSRTRGASGAALDELANTILLLELDDSGPDGGDLQQILEEALARCGPSATAAAAGVGFGTGPGLN